ncbi:MAG: hypothetical protein ABF289_00945 [Clostridiales bacterium]
MKYTSILSFDILLGFRLINILISLTYTVYFTINGGWGEKIFSIVFGILVIRNNFTRADDMALLNHLLTKKVRTKLKLKLMTYVANFLLLIN